MGVIYKYNQRITPKDFPGLSHQCVSRTVMRSWTMEKRRWASLHHGAASRAPAAREVVVLRPVKSRRKGPSNSQA